MNDELSIKTKVNDLRGKIQAVAEEVLQVKKNYSFEERVRENEDRGEAMANFTLAFRHLEDAKMRLGKVIQAVEGVSVYDTPAKKD